MKTSIFNLLKDILVDIFQNLQSVIALMGNLAIWKESKRLMDPKTKSMVNKYLLVSLIGEYTNHDIERNVNK